MAIKNPNTNEYVKVNNFSFDLRGGNYNIQYYRFKDLEQRQRFDSGLSEYENFFHSQYNGIGNIEQALNSAAIGATAKDVILSACYNALKADIFKDWIDC